ncbi:Ethanolamine ammonia-lyase light chain [Psychrobacillus sp. OK028]|uniref:ethanolamine ammonia-lyase subunit EutC n=1 Tax=Psychrobacillus sp. OK028 TaxID=1884359 RepID=UPI000883C0FF|nr:ethanolamine ammonia-lyase subunit EutC [Psychrobacillus sp. OK028]SDN90451.1 Ethanolamine ammonia-lyase light chain [Psychrobacillus sp. OK028]
MNEQLIKDITKMVVEKLQMNNDQDQQNISLYPKDPSGALTETSIASSPVGEVKFYPSNVTTRKRENVNLQTQSEKASKEDDKEKYFTELRSKTPARIAVGRAGTRPKTKTWLQFRYDHAAAVDAVYGEVPKEILDRLNFFQVNTRVLDKEEYIRRPDLGRRLSDDSKQVVLDKCKRTPKVQVVASNGLSAKALEENLEDVYLSLEQSLKNLNIEMGTTFYVDKGRVALMDEIGELLQPDIVVILIGERPGLVSAESLSAYICYKPRIGTIEADRMVVSNIHKGGIPSVEAGAYLGTLIQKILKYEASGVSLVRKEG